MLFILIDSGHITGEFLSIIHICGNAKLVCRLLMAIFEVIHTVKQNSCSIHLPPERTTFFESN